MSRRKALALAFEPDEYLCTWTLPNGKDGTIEVPGALDVAPNRSPRGVVYGDLPIAWEEHGGGYAASFPQTVSPGTLSGRLANGANVTILDAEIVYWVHEQGQVGGSAAILGILPPPGNGNPRFKEVEFQVGALDSVAGVAPLASFTMPTREERYLDSTWSVTGNPESSQEWADSDARVDLSYNGSFRIGDPYEVRFAFAPVISIESDEPFTLREWVDNWVEPTRRIVSIATGTAQDLTALAVRPEKQKGKSHSKSQVFGSGITQDPYESETERTRKDRPAIFLKEDHVSLLELIRAWQRLTQDRHPLIETYGAMLTAKEQHPRSRYLLLIQALEGLYGYETREKYRVDEEKHTVERDGILAAVEGRLDRSGMTFLKRFLMKRPPASLDHALSRMVTGLPVDLLDKIRATSLVKDEMTTNPKADTPVAALRHVRNQLAHGVKGYAADDLHEVVLILEHVVRAQALRLLGCTETIQRRLLERSE